MRINPYRILPVYKSAKVKDQQRKSTAERVQESKQIERAIKAYLRIDIRA